MERQLYTGDFSRLFLPLNLEFFQRLFKNLVVNEHDNQVAGFDGVVGVRGENKTLVVNPGNEALLGQAEISNRFIAGF